MSRLAWVQAGLHKQGPLLLLLIVAAAIRIWPMPFLHELRNGDEVGYVSGGLVAWEGMLPGWRAVPAGPQTWVGWLWMGARSALDLAKQPHDRPPLLKPFMAVDQALFDTYADLGSLRQIMLWISLGVVMIGVFAGYRLGLKYGGETGGVLIGALVALLPLYIEFACVAKSCSDSWMLGIASISCAATMRSGKVAWVPGVLLGLAISSRLDMLVLAPFVIWALWDNLGAKGILSMVLRTGFVSALTLLVTAPWLMVGFVGTLRTVGMARFLGYWNVESPRLTTLKALAWTQGLGPLLLATVVGFFVLPAESRVKKGVLLILTLLLVSSMFIGQYQLMRYHGGPLIAILIAAAVGSGAILSRLTKWKSYALAVLLLILPGIQSLHEAQYQHSLCHVDGSTEWIEKHVPPGTIIYFHCNFACNPVLPTPAAAEAIWTLVANDHAWRDKWQEGFRRFSLPAEQFPRAMSEDNLCMDRAICRRWFILGGGQQARPRYDLRPFNICTSFGLSALEVGDTFKKTGGILIWKTASLEWHPPGLGEPFVKWVSSSGNGTLMFVSEDVRAKLLNLDSTQTSNNSAPGK